MPTDVQHQAMGYDRTATMFSPDGTIPQLEYAQKTVRLGSSIIGMVCSDGVFIIADKRVEDVLVITKSATKIQEVDSHVIISSAGIVSDARVLVDRAQLLAQQHRVTYDSPIEPELIVKELANIQQQFTQYGGARPFGVSFMVAGIHEKKPSLYTSDVTGNYFHYHANAIGENDDKVREKLREKYKQDLTIKKGVKLAVDIIKELKGKKFDMSKMELVYITKEKGKLERLEGDEIIEFEK